MAESDLRDNQWLEQRVKYIWQKYYTDARPGYPIHVQFGPRAHYRYGSIYSSGEECHILVNRLFARPEVPEYVVDATLAHELAHYVHGYGSGLRKLHSHPHRGGVVDREMQKRGCYELEERASQWRRTNWQQIYEKYSADSLKRKADREDGERKRWDAYLAQPGFRTEEYLKNRLNSLSQQFGMDKPAFEVAWLYASVRRNGLSYRFLREGCVRLHGTLADPLTPDYLIDYELCYWLASQNVGERWELIEAELKRAGVWERVKPAIQWRHKVWPRYYLKHHPLKAI